jgi:primosomal protein N'
VTPRLVTVAVPVPALGVLTYRVPDGVAAPPAGARVVVPLGTRTLTGVVLGEGTPPVAGTFEVRDLAQVLDDTAFIPPDVLALTTWVADYYLAGPGAALAAALPPHGLTSRVDAFKAVRVVTLTAQGLDIVERLAAVSNVAGSDEADLPRLGARQREAL